VEDDPYPQARKAWGDLSFDGSDARGRALGAGRPAGTAAPVAGRDRATLGEAAGTPARLQTGSGLAQCDGM